MDVQGCTRNLPTNKLTSLTLKSGSGILQNRERSLRGFFYLFFKDTKNMFDGVFSDLNYKRRIKNNLIKKKYKINQQWNSNQIQLTVYRGHHLSQRQWGPWALLSGCIQMWNLKKKIQKTKLKSIKNKHRASPYFILQWTYPAYLLK